MPNRVDNPAAGSRPEATRPGAQRPEQAQQAAQSAPPPDASSTDRVEISTADRQHFQAPPPESGAAQDAPSAQPQGESSAVGEATREQAEQLREEQRARPEDQQPGNLVDVTG
jgi:hypothetical protein